MPTPSPAANLLVNRDAAPFDNAELRRAMAMALALDRKSFIEILSDGKAKIGGAMLPPPEGLWGMPTDMLETLPGYGPDVQKNRAEARDLMKKLGYGPEKRLPLKVSTRNLNSYRDPAVILIDQLKEIYVDGELDPIETANWFPKIYRKDYKIGLNLTGIGVDDPDAQFNENYRGQGARQACQYGSGAPVEPVQRPGISLPLAQLWIGPPAALAAGQVHAGKLKCGLGSGAFHPRRLSGLIL